MKSGLTYSCLPPMSPTVSLMFNWQTWYVPPPFATACPAPEKTLDSDGVPAPAPSADGGEVGMAVLQGEGVDEEAVHVYGD